MKSTLTISLSTLKTISLSILFLEVNFDIVFCFTSIDKTYLGLPSSGPCAFFLVPTLLCYVLLSLFRFVHSRYVSSCMLHEIIHRSDSEFDLRQGLKVWRLGCLGGMLARGLWVEFISESLEEGEDGGCSHHLLPSSCRG